LADHFTLATPLIFRVAHLSAFQEKWEPLICILRASFSFSNFQISPGLLFRL
jgi:hypothetical protein